MTILSKSVAYRYLYFLADSAIPSCNYRAAMLITKTNKTVRFMLVTKLICLISSIATLGARQHHQRHRHHHHLSVAIIINIVRNEEKWKITSQAYYYLCFHLNFSLSTIAVERRARRASSFPKKIILTSVWPSFLSLKNNLWQWGSEVNARIDKCEKCPVYIYSISWG